MMRVVVGGEVIPTRAKKREVQPLVPEDLEWEKLSLEELLTYAATDSLLGDQRAFKLTGALSSSRAEEFLEALSVFVTSPHQFIFSEEKLLKKITDKLTKAGVEVLLPPPAKEKKPEEGFAIFSLTYAFATRDKKKLWLLLIEALRRGTAPEAVAGILHWKVRDMLVKRDIKAFSRPELMDLSRTLAAAYHDSHRGGGDLELLLERFVLLL